MKQEQGIKVRLEDIIDSISEEKTILGDTRIYVTNALPLDQADSSSICFCKKTGEQALHMIENSNALAIICSNSLTFDEFHGKTLIQVGNPRLTYSRILDKFFFSRPTPTVHPTAVIDQGAIIGKRVSIGPGTYIGESQIGDDAIIEGHVYIGSNVTVGTGVIVRVGVVVGTEAIAFERNNLGKLEWFPQIGGIIIQDNVEIGANSVICRGALSDTFIGSGTKIDNLVRIGHGVMIGNDCIIVGGTIINGSVKVGNQTWIGPLVCIRESVKIGNKVMVGAGAVVHKDVPDGLVVSGSPARPIISDRKP
jgi:UDP-3-O-[3-hydroxymyristoyl] glucosamine N-acyltransferase